MRNSENGKTIVFVVLLGLMVACLGSYIVYDKFLNKNSNCDSSSLLNTDMQTSSAYNYNLSKRKTAQAVREGCIEVLVDTDGNVYLHIIKNSEYEIEKTKTGIQNLEKQFKNFTPKGYESLGGEEFKAVRLNIKNALTAYFVHLGNGGFTYFIFVSEEGKLTYLNYDKVISDGDINVKEINSLNNIVSIVDNTNTMTPYAIDVNGKEISLNEYIN